MENHSENDLRYKPLCYRIWRVLSKILIVTYPGIATSSFYVSGNSKIIGVLGKYTPLSEGTGEIVLYRLYRPIPHLITTAIHELAHHADFCLRKKTDHSPVFYNVFAQLLYTALDYNVVDHDILLNEVMTGSDRNKIKNILSRYTRKERPPLFDDKKIIEVAQSYSFRDILHARGYSYDPVKKNWYREFDVEKVENEVRYLSTLTTSQSISVSHVSQVTRYDEKTIYVVLRERDAKKPADAIIASIEADLENAVTRFPQLCLQPYTFSKNYFSLTSIYPGNFWAIKLPWREAEKLYRYFDTYYKWSRRPLELTYYI